MVCPCSNGFGNRGENCYDEGSESCHKCKDGYILDLLGTCEECCPNGVAAPTCGAEWGSVQCGGCNAGFTLHHDKCVTPDEMPDDVSTTEMYADGSFWASTDVLQTS